MISFTLFNLDSIKLPTEKLSEDFTKEKLKCLLGGGEIEACSDYGERVINGNNITEILANSLAEASFSAYNDHRALIISPDHIWITLTQGLANHVNQNAEELRHLFVNHEEKLELTLSTYCGIPKFVLEGDEKDWIAIHSRISGEY